MDWGASFDKIVAAAGPVASTLPCVINRADPAEHLRFEWSAFRSLSSDRQIGMGLGPIPWSSIDRFALRFSIVGDDFDRFCALIQAMDEAYRGYEKGKT